jgi:predicted anti-sigma-YlaC factor YlaD
MIDALQQVVSQLERLSPEEQAFLAEDLQRWLAKPEWERKLYAKWAKDLPEQLAELEKRPPRYLTEEEFFAELDAIGSVEDEGQ